ncbi:membrane-bound PQQ-dependent dehydrogenase, glucose/quinate/shikimate family [Pseudooceanicola sp. CBS1P-1]|uniref:Membrane-bound PQQ-dependent dehydrogenase, glucose/quinate/shikimate family n=1 Tax=Pseudooceanicola albus TaxID=2692189 RepID=A0A6L7G724_9RHOB|nr:MULTISPECIES: membrane-bound PQQ-dependent dehydrogenase, glucose/quinate/shikimate family [Pseudooceanicola]MBT9383008.1 membrane-bound PQQ-dependent dehydrogenase, glucose/quinate/shikimate family [Pseudooceanicola endophyticus]MXN19196.1 membrane-bound PQQ-dependent dehydrogenase, glucose/quinate/shikimate family [Pseudooceanicola albus]
MTDKSPSLSRPLTVLLVLLGAVIALLGACLAVGGVMLIARGGSWYYLLMGLALIASGIQILRGRPSGTLIYLVAFALTVIWAFWEAGLDFWALHARIFTFLCALMVILALHPLTLKRAGRPAMAGPWLGLACVALIAVAGMGYGMFIPHGQHNFEVASGKVPAPADGRKDWSSYGADGDENRFAALDQITPANVKDLKVAWTFRTGDVPISPGGGGFEDQNTPLQVGKNLFICTPSNTVISLDATSGKENWRHDFPTDTRTWVRCRGLAYFDAAAPLPAPTLPGSTPVTPVDLSADAACQRRIFMNTIDAVLVALDADTGALCQDFGTDGKVDLKEGLGAAQAPLYSLTSPPTLAGSTVVVGGRVADNVALDMPGGVMRGFDVITGQMKWAFDPGNPEDRNAPADGNAYTRSTPNVWAPMTYDAASNTVFMPVGNAAIDLWGVKRTPEDEKYGASILALDATTGNEKWVYQTVHHDLWDFDVPMQPTLIDFKGTPALVVGTKAGQIFVLDRVTGKPLTEVKEVPVKGATIPGEKYALTQPKSVGMPQIGAPHLSEADMWGATPFDQMMCRIIFKGYRYEGLFTAPDTDYSLSFPGSLGGMNWGGLSYDPTADTIFVNDMRLGLWVHMEPQDQGAKASNGSEAVNTVMGAVPLKGTPYSVMKNRFLSPLGIPCQEPPFGSLTAIDMKTQKVAWEAPLGTVQDTVLFGAKMRMPMPVGMPTIGGSLATQGGLVFFAATQDYYLRAFDSATGKEVWKARMPVGSQGTPISYVSQEDGRQYIVISAGGARQSPDRGDYLIAYALPKS